MHNFHLCEVDIAIWIPTCPTRGSNLGSLFLIFSFEKMFEHLPRPNIWGKTVAIWAAMVARWSLAAHVGSGALLSHLSLSNESVGDIANTSWSKIHPKWHMQTMQAIVNELWASHSRQTMTGTSRIYIKSKKFKKKTDLISIDYQKFTIDVWFTRYHQTKLANAVFTLGLADRLTAANSKA